MYWDDWTLLKENWGSNLYRKLDITTIEDNIFKRLVHVSAEKCSIFEDDTIGLTGCVRELTDPSSLETSYENLRAR